jgi:DNA-binding transcriptional LysR family regulator
MSDSLLLGLAKSLHDQLTSAAPGITLVFVAWHGSGQALDGLAKGDVDLAVSQFPNVGAPIHRQTLTHEDYRVLMRKGHPAAKNFNLDTWLAWPHVVVSGRGEVQSSVDQILLGLGRNRTVAMVVPSFIVAPHLVRHSNMIAMLPSSAIPQNADKHFVICDPPVNIEGYAIHLAWHARQNNDRTIRYLAELIELHFKGNLTASNSVVNN